MLGEVKILALLLQEMIRLSINACFQILLIVSLYIKLLYACNWIEVNKILFTLKCCKTLLCF